MRPIKLPDMKLLRDAGVLSTIEESGFVALNHADVSIVLIEIEAVAKEIEQIYDILPPTAKADALKLAHSLSAIKSKLQYR